MAAEKIKVSKPKINVLNSIVINPEQYKKGFTAQNISRGLCGCNYCRELLASVNDKGFENSKAAEVLSNFAADAKRERMSITVSKPGFFALKGLSKKTGGQFDYVFFPQAGKYSLVSIYKNCREKGGNFPDGPLTSRLKQKLDEKQIKEFSGVFGNVIPLGVSNRTQLERKTPSWKIVESEIYGLLSGETKTPPPSLDGVFIIFDRFIPMLYSGGSIYKILEDGSPEQGVLIPNLESDDETASKAYIASQFEELRKTVTGGNTSIVFAGYDVVENKIVYALEIAELIHGAIKNNLKAYNKIATVASLVEALPGPLTFVDKLNENFAKMGAEGFTVDSVFPMEFTTSYSAMDFESGDNEQKSTIEKCYFVNVSHNGKPTIGAMAGGFIYVRTNDDLDEFVLVQSKWCQRISSWSKNVEGIVDQHYNIWPIADWLSGPWSDKKGLKKEQMVFSGNKNRTSKTDAIADLRARMRDKLA